MKKDFTREEEGFWGYVADDYVYLAELVPPPCKGIEAQHFEPYEEGHREQFASAMTFIRFLFKKHGDDFKCYRYTPDKLVRVHKSPEDIVAWLEEAYEAGNYGDLELGVCFDITERLIPKRYLPYISALRVPKDQKTVASFEKERHKPHDERPTWNKDSAWTIWSFTDEEVTLLRDKGVFYFLEYMLEPYFHVGVIKDHKKLQGTIAALRVKDYQYEPTLAKLIEKMIQMIEEAIKRGVGLFFSY